MIEEAHLLSSSYLRLLLRRKQGRGMMKYKDVLADRRNGAVHPDISGLILCA